MLQPVKWSQKYSWMLIKRFLSNTIIKTQHQEQYINLQTDPLDNSLTTWTIETTWEMVIELFPKWLFRYIGNPAYIYRDCSVQTGGRIMGRTWSGTPEPLLSSTMSISSVKVIMASDITHWISVYSWHSHLIGVLGVE